LDFIKTSSWYFIRVFRGFDARLFLLQRLFARGFFSLDPAMCSASAQTNSLRCTLVASQTLRPGPRTTHARRLRQRSEMPRLPQYALVRCVLVVFGASAGAEDELPLDDLPFHVFLGQHLR
jgi:hypothetical protein